MNIREVKAYETPSGHVEKSLIRASAWGLHDELARRNIRPVPLTFSQCLSLLEDADFLFGFLATYREFRDQEAERVAAEALRDMPDGPEPPSEK